MTPFTEPLESRRLLASVPAGFFDEPWGGTLPSGAAMEFAPDGRLLVLTQTGAVRVIDSAGNLLPQPALTLNVAVTGEGGLIGIALDPGFASNGYVYLHFSNPVPAVSMV